MQRTFREICRITIGLVLTISFLVSGCSESGDIVLDENDNGSYIELDQGQVLFITLDSKPSTGYSWQKDETDKSILQQIGETEFLPFDTGDSTRPGAGGREQFQFDAVGSGQMTLKLTYSRPWEKDVEPIKTFTIQVLVR